MKLQTKVSVEKEVDLSINIPFLKRRVSNYGSTDYIAVFDEKTCYDIFISDGVVHFTLSPVERKTQQIVNAMAWEDVPEEEYLTIHANILASLSLMPVLVNHAEEKNQDDLGELFSPITRPNE